MNKHENVAEVEDLDVKEPQITHSTYVPGSEEEKKLVRKIDLYLLPAIWLMYLFSFMDRTK